MKKFSVSVFVILSILAFSYCSSSKKATAAAPAPAPMVPKKMTYAVNVKPIIEANCAPCHFPDKGGNKKALDTYTAVTAQTDDLLRRIQLQPTERGFMPRQHPKLADADINTLKQWKTDGLTEK